LRSLDPNGEVAVLSAEVLAYATRDAELRDWMAGLLVNVRGRMAESFAAAQRTGELRADVTPATVAMLTAALGDGLIFHGLIDPELPLDTVANTLDVLLAGPSSKEE
jgi:BetI-type transcriptional repressor, C-terminal